MTQTPGEILALWSQLAKLEHGVRLTSLQREELAAQHATELKPVLWQVKVDDVAQHRNSDGSIFHLTDAHGNAHAYYIRGKVLDSVWMGFSSREYTVHIDLVGLDQREHLSALKRGDRVRVSGFPTRDGMMDFYLAQARIVINDV